MNRNYNKTLKLGHSYTFYLANKEDAISYSGCYLGDEEVGSSIFLKVHSDIYGGIMLVNPNHIESIQLPKDVKRITTIMKEDQ